MLTQVDRITCCISVAAGSDLPGDGHAFWDVQDSLGEALAVLAARFCGSIGDPVCAEFRRSNGLLWISSDTPRGVHYFWILLPSEAAFRSAVIETTLSHLGKARALLPNADWEVHLADQPVAWNAARAEYVVT